KLCRAVHARRRLRLFSGDFSVGPPHGDPSSPSLSRSCSMRSNETTKNRRFAAVLSPLPDSNRRPPPYHSWSGVGFLTRISPNHACFRSSLVARIAAFCVLVHPWCTPRSTPLRDV